MRAPFGSSWFQQEIIIIRRSYTGGYGSFTDKEHVYFSKGMFSPPILLYGFSKKYRFL
jgi:hypothetical protein